MSVEKWAYSSRCDNETCSGYCDSCRLYAEYNSSLIDDDLEEPETENIDSIVLENHIDQYTSDIHDMVSLTIHNRDKETDERARFASLMVTETLIECINKLNQILEGLASPETPNVIDQRILEVRGEHVV